MKSYFDDIEEVIACITDSRPNRTRSGGGNAKVSVTTAHLKAALKLAKTRKLSPIQIAMLQQAIEFPVYLKQLLNQFNEHRKDMIARLEDQAAHDNSLAACIRFLEDWERKGMAKTVPHGGAIPGYPNQGAGAVRALVDDLSKNGL